LYLKIVHNYDSGIIDMQNNFSCQLPRTVAVCPQVDWFWPSLGEYKHRQQARSGLRVGRSSGAVSCQPLGKHFIN